MARYLRDIMTQRPVTLRRPTRSSPRPAPCATGTSATSWSSTGQIQGILTDRDIVVRALAEGRDPARTTVGEICSRELTTLCPDDAIGDAEKIMRDQAIRRLPVVEEGRPVGIVSLGDLAVEKNPESTLGGISAAPPNR